MKCWKCGVNELSISYGYGSYGDGICQSCRNKPEVNKYTFVGYQSAWICHKCGSVYGPSQNECIRCNSPITPVVTC
jgi:hypothetical protein